MKTTLPYWLLAVAFAVGCQRSALVDEPTLQERDAQVALNLNTAGIWDDVTSKSYSLTLVQEKQIKSLEVLVFNAAGRLVSRHRLENPASLTNTINTKSGSGMSIYVVTNATLTVNASTAPNDALGRATTIDSLRNIKVTNLLVDVATNQTLIMYGVAENVTINPAGGNSITIPLDYVAAKMTVNLYSTLPASESFELVDWRLGSLARYSYLFPRVGDVVNPSNATDFVTQSTGNAWNDGTINIAGVPTPVKTTTFYVFENRRGTTANANPKLKSGPTAPASATQFLARGFYSTATAVKGIDIKVMLGENSTNDYNIKRKSEYVYNIKVTSFTDFTVETRYEDAGVGFQTEIVNRTLDAHYDMRPIKVGAYSGTSTVTILDANGLPTTNTFWLKLSAKNITQFIDNGSGTYVRPTYNPLTEMLQTSTYLHAPTSGMDFTMRYLYADEYLVDNGTRTAKVVVSNSSNPTTTPVTYTITQRGALVAGRVGLRVINAVGALTSTDYVLATEIFEEATMAITPGNLVNERTSTMQWGFYGTLQLASGDHTRRDGYDNTQNLVLSNIAAGTLRTPYGRTGNGTITHATHDPIYNTYAARYCFEKNRDANGDGVITGSEIRWYLPSPEEQILIYVGNLSWSAITTDRWTSGNIYLSSTPFSLTEAIVFSPASGTVGINPKNTPLYVRCVRQLPPTP